MAAGIESDLSGWKCPRCGRMTGAPVAFSRGTVERDVPVCGLCGELESMRDAVGMPVQSPDDWPVAPDELGREFARLAAFSQGGRVLEAEVDPETARDVLSGEWSSLDEEEGR